MRILFLIDNFSLGGAQTVVKGLMEHAKLQGDTYAIALREKEPVMPINHPGALTFPSPSKYSFRVYRYLKHFIEEKQIDILHCQLPRSIAMGYLLKRVFPGIKYIIHEQGDVFESRMHACLLRIFRSKADMILGCSEATAAKLSQRSKIDPQKIRVLYNFVDLDRFAPRKESLDNIEKIAFAGRIEKRKGWREFIGAAMGLQDRKELKFYLAGSGTELKALRRAIANAEEAQIQYMGFVDQMEEFYLDMDLLVIPSHFEPMGMVAVEAMACGLPVLATDVPGLNEVVRHQVNGWTCARKSTGDLIESIKKILAMPTEQKAAVVRRGLEDAQTFSLKEFTASLQLLYDDLR